jgi:hypothetical protein
MKSYIKQKLRESLSIPIAKLPKNIKINEQDIPLIKSISPNDIILNESENIGDITYMDISFTNRKLNKISKGINFYIQVIKGTWFHPHLFIAENLQSMGLGYKILYNFLSEFGHFYVGMGRVLNDSVYKILDKIKKDKNFDYYEGEYGMLFTIKNNPDIKKLVRIV